MLESGGESCSAEALAKRIMRLKNGIDRICLAKMLQPSQHHREGRQIN
ncbi:hypothetical protein [endosymbiont of Ridgeia piscesae]|jgi:hypothetical protein|uniref:Uncharacterized protein n=1 Tax=endosymbiont of Ridgeia piscesae TaxID=54398 RepID=A0A0T5Z5K2_9GAMM|nr:hypothetical protein [endosymbiont of Ridgeia piscesae]KRT54623.1 hypothetical protein Ga0074115_10834 [endosymbiont of Ridgeia piscesae]KRT57774.1 hypothetical protein Ga0076813_12185 [endosymbiont of Ridgeia piscesae]